MLMTGAGAAVPLPAVRAPAGAFSAATAGSSVGAVSAAPTTGWEIPRPNIAAIHTFHVRFIRNPSQFADVAFLGMSV